MDARRTALLAMLVATLAVALGSATSARAVTEVPPPLPPDQATTLASTDAAVTSGSSTQPADAAAVLDAATVPGAQTSIESDLSPQAAVGLALPSDGSVLSATRPVC